jgi:hypothetical protein
MREQFSGSIFRTSAQRQALEVQGGLGKLLKGPAGKAGPIDPIT